MGCDHGGLLRRASGRGGGGRGGVPDSRTPYTFWESGTAARSPYLPTAARRDGGVLERIGDVDRAVVDEDQGAVGAERRNEVLAGGAAALIDGKVVVEKDRGGVVHAQLLVGGGEDDDPLRVRVDDAVHV